MTKKPSASVVAARENPVPSCVAETCAPATPAPAGSVTRPRMLPNPCACEKSGANRSTKKAISTFLFMDAFPFRGHSERTVSDVTSSCGAPWASNAQLRLSHQHSKETQHSLLIINLLNNRYQMFE